MKKLFLIFTLVFLIQHLYAQNFNVLKDKAKAAGDVINKANNVINKLNEPKKSDDSNKPSSSTLNCTIYQDVILETHTKECQACYKKITYDYLVQKIHWGDCTEKSEYLKNLDCLNKTLKRSAYSGKDYGASLLKIQGVRNAAKSKCSESRSGTHLWKEVKITSESMFNHEKIENLKDNYYCKLLEGLEKKSQEDSFAAFLIIGHIDELNKL